MGCGFAVGGFYLAPWLHVWFGKGIPCIARSVFPKKVFKHKWGTPVAFMLVD